MAKGQHLSGYQRGIVSRYYDNLDTISLQKLSETVSDLFVATSDKAAEKLWKSADAALRRAKVEEARIVAIVGKKDVHALATLINELAGPPKGKR